MWMLPRLRLALARRPWLYWMLVCAAAALTWWRIAALHDDAERARASWGTSVTVVVASADTPQGQPVQAEQRTLPRAAVPSTALRDVAADAVAARDLVVGQVLLPTDLVGDEARPAGWVVVAVRARSPRLVAGDEVTLFAGGRQWCDGRAEGETDDDTVALAVPPDCAAALSALGATDDVVVGRRG